MPMPRSARPKLSLAYAINGVIARRRLTQAAAAEKLSLNQPKVSALANYKLDGFSVERLMTFLTALDQDVEIVIRKKPRSRAVARISVVRPSKRLDRLPEGSFSRFMMRLELRFWYFQAGVTCRRQPSVHGYADFSEGLFQRAAECRAGLQIRDVGDPGAVVLGPEHDDGVAVHCHSSSLNPNSSGHSSPSSR
jgi:predicted XRE-type DNA-binding protein